MFQNLLVGIIVLLAVLFAAWRLPGAATRLRYLAWLKRCVGVNGALHRWLTRREASILRTAAGAACSGCSAESEHHPPDAAAKLRK